MEWQSEAILLGTRDLGENSTIIEVFTEERGAYHGVVRGGKSKRIAPILQPGAQINVIWRARLESHLGTFSVELLRSRFSLVINQRAALAGLNSISGLLRFSLAERDPHPGLYHRTIELLDSLTQTTDWPLLYLKWELALLEDMGFGLDLECCAVTGETDNLIYISPKTGRAISESAAGRWAKNLLPLPPCLSSKCLGSDEGIDDGYQVTEYFLKNWLVPFMSNRPLPPARRRLVEVLRKEKKLK